MFKKPFSFEGRIRRTEYGVSYLIYLGFALIVNLSAEFLNELVYILFIGYIPMIWFLWAQGAKRCHDRGNSGWYQIIPFYALLMLFGDSDYGENEYGPNPKDLGNTDIIDEFGSNLDT